MIVSPIMSALHRHPFSAKDYLHKSVPLIDMIREYYGCTEESVLWRMEHGDFDKWNDSALIPISKTLMEQFSKLCMVTPNYFNLDNVGAYSENILRPDYRNKMIKSLEEYSQVLEDRWQNPDRWPERI